MGHNNIIELNGKQYDAISGALLGESRIKATPAKRQTATKPAAYRGRVIDGFVRNSSQSATAPAHAKAVHVPAQTKPAAVAATAAKPVAAKRFDIARPKAKVVAARQPSRSKTLMRHAVQKPQTSMKPAIKPTLPTEMMARPKSELTKQLEKKLSVTNVNPLRMSHAKQVAKSHHIRRFNHAQKSHVLTPAAAPAQSHVVTQPAVAQTHTAHPQPRPATTRPKPAAQAAADNNDIFEAALAVANSHKQPAPAAKQIKARSFRRRRLVSALAGVGAFLVIGGFVAYLNAPAIELHVASVKAGFNAAAPGYAPMGYARTNVQANEGKVVLQFRSGDSSYNITQIASDWNSQTLLDYYTDAYGAPERTIESQGRTIYLYDNTRAAWVNGGVRYEINGNAALNADDLVSLATSL